MLGGWFTLRGFLGFSSGSGGGSCGGGASGLSSVSVLIAAASSPLILRKFRNVNLTF